MFSTAVAIKAKLCLRINKYAVARRRQCV